MESAEITQIIELVGQFGFSVVFLWLFVREMNSHEETRSRYRADLREIAGMRAEAFIRERDEDASSPRSPAGLREQVNGKE